MKDVVIPNGVKTIEDWWFKNSEIENVEIPASVREIEAEAFRDCSNLTPVTFAEGSRLEKIGAGCF